MLSPAVAPVTCGGSPLIRDLEPSAPDEIEYAPLRRVDRNPESAK
ncbi:hypothetical protein AB0M92_22190 [Streptomyces sp. NPDC051582]